MKPFACGAIALCLMPLTLARAQNQAVDDLKGKIFDARMAKQTFAGGLKFCSELKASIFISRREIASSIWRSITARWAISPRNGSLIPRSAGRGPSRTPPNAGTRFKNKRPATKSTVSSWQAFPRSRSSSMSWKRKWPKPAMSRRRALPKNRRRRKANEQVSLNASSRDSRPIRPPSCPLSGP